MTLIGVCGILRATEIHLTLASTLRQPPGACGKVGLMSGAWQVTWHRPSFRRKPRAPPGARARPCAVPQTTVRGRCALKRETGIAMPSLRHPWGARAAQSSWALYLPAARRRSIRSFSGPLHNHKSGRSTFEAAHGRYGRMARTLGAVRRNAGPPRCRGCPPSCPSRYRVST
jgi:hypothetical protein